MEIFIETIIKALPAIASAIIIGVFTFAVAKAKKVKARINELLEEHIKLMEHEQEHYEDIKELKEGQEAANNKIDSLKKAERRDVKAHIVSLYERCEQKGSVSPMELETINGLNDSYHNDLDGNTYVGTIVGRLNSDFPIKGIPIPPYEKH